MAALTITASQVLLVNGPSATVTWDTTVTRGMSVRYAPTTGKWGPAQSDNDTTDSGLYGLGIALSDGGAAQQGVVALPGSLVDLGAGAAAAAGTVYVAPATAGNIAPTADVTTTGQFRGIVGLGAGSNRVRVIGVGAESAIP